MKIVYLLYILKKTSYSKLRDLIKYTAEIKGWSYFKVIKQLCYYFFKYDLTFLDYFYFKCYDTSEEKIATYAQTLYMYRFQSALNQKSLIPYFKNKAYFYKKFNHFITHKYFVINNDSNNQERLSKWLKTHRPQHLICKDNKGQVGKAIQKVTVHFEENKCLIDGVSIKEFHTSFIKKNYLIEFNIEQHEVLSNFHPDSLNTVRIITVLDRQAKLHIIGAMIRIGTNQNHIDNFDAGGVSARINIETGVIDGPLFYKSPFEQFKDTSKHPTTLRQIKNIQLPYWKELIELVKKITYVVPEMRTVGWDIAITPQGPALLEGNHNWDKTHWQIVYEKGMKTYLNEFLER